MTVRQLLHKKGYGIISTRSETTVYDALVVMAERVVGALAVIDEGELVDDREIILMGRRSRDTGVHEVMSAPVITIGLNDTVDRCMELMTNNRFRHLPVVEDGVAVAMVSIGDLVKTIIEQQAAMIEQLESYIDRR